MALAWILRDKTNYQRAHWSKPPGAGEGLATMLSETPGFQRKSCELIESILK